MPNDPLANAVETFAAPIEGLIIALGQGVAQAQQALDQNSIQTQEQIDADPVLSQHGLQATWYQFPSVTMQLKLSLSIAQDQSPQSAPAGNVAPSALRVIAQPLSASFQTHFNYDAQAASQINLTMVPVPAPSSGNAVSNPPRMTQAAVLAAAFASSAPFVTTLDGQKNKIPAPTNGTGDALNIAVNFNATARTWYVLQWAPSNATVPTVSVAVDDVTGSVRIV
jgi:hypothetical protein